MAYGNRLDSRSKHRDIHACIMLIDTRYVCAGKDMWLGKVWIHGFEI